MIILKCALDTMSNARNDHDRDEYKKDLVGLFDNIVEYWDGNMNKVFTRPKDILVADAIIELIRTREMIENFNKKALYVLVREMTGYSTQHITKVINVLKKHYRNLIDEYERTGTIKL